MFNYFLVAVGFLASAYGVLLQEEPLGALAVAIVGIVACIVSIGFDMRNHQLVKLGRELLIDLEQRHLFPAGQPSESVDSAAYGILYRESKRGGPVVLLKHKVLIRFVETVCAIAFVAGAMYAACQF